MPTEFDDIDDLSDLGDLGDLDIGDIDGIGDDAEGNAPGVKTGIFVRKKKIILISIVAVLALAVGSYLFTGSDSSSNTKDEVSEEDEDDDEQKSTPYYFSLDPVFVVNFVGRGQAKFLQVNIGGLTRDPSVKEDITLHLPHIRNNIVLLLSSKTYDEMITAEGKENLRKEILAEARKILRQETGKDEIEDIYFTSFVMQ